MENISKTQENMFLSTPLGILFAKTATPIILIMMTNGLFTIVDGWFLGRFVGADALSAVTMVFPAFMMLVALTTLVSAGFSSVLARLLGAGNRAEGEEAMVSAITLSIIIYLILALLFTFFGSDLILAIANGSTNLAYMGHEYMAITIYFSGLFFLMSALSDSFRCQGKLGPMVAITLTATTLNILFNYALIVEFDMGVAGSAYGTAMAQGGAVIAALFYQYSEDSCLRFRLHKLSGLWRNWGAYLALGAPPSLTYIGVSIISASIIYQLQVWNGDMYEVSVAAYGIVTRLFTFGFMPLLGLTLAQQTIVGNNFGAKNWDRTLRSLKFTIIAATLYCGGLQIVFLTMPGEIAGIFVDNPLVIAETTRILPILSYLYFLFGPLLMFPTFFQAIGDAKRSALLGLTKIYLLNVPLILLVPLVFGEVGIWYAGPMTEIAALLLTVMVLYQTYNSKNGWLAFLQSRA